MASIRVFILQFPRIKLLKTENNFSLDFTITACDVYYRSTKHYVFYRLSKNCKNEFSSICSDAMYYRIH